MASLQFTPPAGSIRATTSTALSEQPDRIHHQPAVVQGGISPQQQQQQQPQPQHQHQQQPIHNLVGSSASPSLQNQRVARLLQSATGACASSSPAFPNRFSSSPATQGHFFASSAPSSAGSLPQNVSARPPVPPFPHHSTGSIPQIPGKMVLEDLQGLNDYTAGLESSSFSSPSMAAPYDLTMSVSSSSTSNPGTVSPNDLLLQDPFSSAPNSSAFTALTSPSEYNDSPYNSSFDVSPNFGSSDLDVAGNEAWFPLFAQDTAAAPAPAITPAAGAQASPSTAADELESEVASPRRKSGHARTSSVSTKHSSTSGVNSRRRDKPLPPIIVDDPSDTVAMKRARNTLAARKSRERKAMRMEELEEKIAQLEKERDHWKDLAQGRKA